MEFLQDMYFFRSFMIKHKFTNYSPAKTMVYAPSLCLLKILNNDILLKPDVYRHYDTC